MLTFATTTAAVDRIPQIWRALATNPEHLELCWTRFRATHRLLEAVQQTQAADRASSDGKLLAERLIARTHPARDSEAVLPASLTECRVVRAVGTYFGSSAFLPVRSPSASR